MNVCLIITVGALFSKISQKSQPGDCERFAHFSAKNLFEIGLMEEKSHS